MWWWCHPSVRASRQSCEQTTDSMQRTHRHYAPQSQPRPLSRYATLCVEGHEVLATLLSYHRLASHGHTELQPTSGRGVPDRPSKTSAASWSCSLASSNLLLGLHKSSVFASASPGKDRDHDMCAGECVSVNVCGRGRLCVGVCGRVGRHVQAACESMAARVLSVASVATDDRRIWRMARCGTGHSAWLGCRGPS